LPGFNIQFASDCGVAPESNGPANTVETARRHRYSLEVLEPLGRQDNGILLFLERCTRPAVEFDKIVIHSGQDEIARPGKTHWKEIEFSFYEALSGQDNGSLENQCASLIYEWWSSTMLDVSTSTFRAPGDFLKNAQLQMLDGDGSPVWSYHIYDCWPLKVSPSELAYSDSNIATISVTLCYSRAREINER